MKIIFSFDDCNLGDLRAAKLLKQYGFKGTFYMPSSQVKGTQLLSLKEVFDGILGQDQEIGGHTVTHPMDMKACSNEQLKFECENNRFLVMLLQSRYDAKEGKPTPVQGYATKFCYPRGRHDERVRKAVQDAGYLEARTTQVLKLQNDSGDPYQTPTTIHMFARDEYEGVDWLELAKKFFETAIKLDRSGTPDIFFSVWGHTKELTEHSEWGKFEELLKFIKGYPQVAIGANGAKSI